MHIFVSFIYVKYFFPKQLEASSSGTEEKVAKKTNLAQKRSDLNASGEYQTASMTQGEDDEEDEKEQNEREKTETVENENVKESSVEEATTQGGSDKDDKQEEQTAGAKDENEQS